MSAELKTLLTVHGGGRTIIEKWLNDWLGNRCSTLNSGFKIFTFSQNFKTTFGYYLSNFCVIISGQCCLFVPEDRSIEEKIDPKNIRYFSFLSENTEKISIYLEDD